MPEFERESALARQVDRQSQMLRAERLLSSHTSTDDERKRTPNEHHPAREVAEFLHLVIRCCDRLLLSAQSSMCHIQGRRLSQLPAYVLNWFRFSPGINLAFIGMKLQWINRSNLPLAEKDNCLSKQLLHQINLHVAALPIIPILPVDKSHIAALFAFASPSIQIL